MSRGKLLALAAILLTQAAGVIDAEERHLLAIAAGFTNAPAPTTEASLLVDLKIAADLWTKSSGGRITFTAGAYIYHSTKTIDLKGCDFSWAVGGLQEAQAVGKLATGIREVFFVIPRSRCAWASQQISDAVATPSGSLFNGTPSAYNMTHEYGHQLGLQHAHRIALDVGGPHCTPLPPDPNPCPTWEYGPHEIMGSALLTTGAANRQRLGWLAVPNLPRVNQAILLGDLDDASTRLPRGVTIARAYSGAFTLSNRGGNIVVELEGSSYVTTLAPGQGFEDPLGGLSLHALAGGTVQIVAFPPPTRTPGPPPPTFPPQRTATPASGCPVVIALGGCLNCHGENVPCSWTPSPTRRIPTWTATRPPVPTAAPTGRIPTAQPILARTANTPRQPSPPAPSASPSRSPAASSSSTPTSTRTAVPTSTSSKGRRGLCAGGETVAILPAVVWALIGRRKRKGACVPTA